MGTTPNLLLPYPEPTDPADVPTDIHELASRLDLLIPSVVSSLPASPVDGQVIAYVASATAGVIWLLRYRAASTDSKKWECVGGSPLVGESMAQVTGNAIASGAWSAIDAVTDPKVTLPLAGDYDAFHTVSFGGQGSATYITGLRINSTDPTFGGAGNNAVSAVGGAAGASVSLTQRRRLTGRASGDVLQQRYFHNTGSATNLTRQSAHLAVWPVRVG